MASKSKSRRRVFRASCILAALIVAGSSFAWFTSSDEVTNRLSASSDYGVSIVESFTPPKNMLPGQEVNKDVYAVNTGNIAAFVKEDVSGVLNYTYETKVNTWDDKCVELTLAQVAAIQGNTTEDGFKTVEAGGFLAWTNAVDKAASVSYSVGDDSATVDSSIAPLSGVRDSSDPNTTTTEKTFSVKVTVGSEVYYAESADNNAPLYTVNTAPDPDQYTLVSGKTLKKTDNAAVAAPTVGPVYSGREQDITEPWTPSVEGVYVFRRSIGGDSDHPTFKYAGYYYKDGKYYKVVLGDDAYRAANENSSTTPTSYQFDVSSSSLGTGITVDKDGIVTAGTPKVSFVKDNEVKDKTVNFTYEDNSGHPRLVVNYAVDAPTTTENGVEYDASAYAARKEVDYYNKLGASNKATVEYEQAKAEYDYAKALSDARDILKTAAQARFDADDALNNSTTGKKALYNTAWTNLQNAVIKNDNSGLIYKYNDNVKKEYLTKYTIDGTVTPNNIGVASATSQLFTATAIARINSDSPFELPKAKENLTKMGQLATRMGTLDGNLWTALKNIATKTSADEYNPADVATDISNLKTTVGDLKKVIEDYKDAYSQIVDDATTASALGLSDTTATKTAIQGLADYVDGLKGSLDSVASAYKTAYDEYKAAEAANATAQITWEKAIDTYNTTVGKPSVSPDPATGATLTYESIVKKTAPTIQTPTATAYSDTNATSGTTKNIVKTYSANNTDDNANPQLDKDANKNNYTALKGLGNAAPDATNMNSKKSAMDTALAATDTAKGEYDVAKDVLNASSKIKIYVNLDDAYNTYWQRDTNTDGTNDVVFYLRSILDAGETSGKLIDSVVLDKDTTARDYKNLTFDLNVGLDSAQINYANDQRTITTEATEGWGMTPTLTTPTDIETAVAWATPVATP